MTDPWLRAGPGVRDWRDAAAAAPADVPSIGGADSPAARRARVALSDALARRFTAAPPPGTGVKTEELVGPGGRVRRYRAAGPRPRPAVLSLHGGGWVLGSIDEEINRRLLTARAVASGVDQFDLEYRLAPEHPFPAAVADALATLRWLLDPAAGIDVDPARVAVAGTSAGGNLAALLAQHARDEGLPLALQVLEVPAVTLAIDGDASFREFGAMEEFGDLSELRAAYLPADRPDALDAACPDRTADLAGLAPALVLTAELDPLRDSAERYVERLRAAGVPTAHHRAAGLPHGGSGLTAVNPEARAWHDRVAAELRRRLVRPLCTSGARP